MPRFRKTLTRALCGSAALCVTVSLFSLLAVSASFAQNVQDGRAVFAERRIRAYKYLGADEDIIRMTLPRITRQEGDAPGGWVYEWSAIGQYYEDLGDAAISRRAALDAYMTAGVYYSIAWFPRIESDEQDQAYTAQLNVYQKGGELFDVPLEVVNVPFRDGRLITYLHKPVGVENPQLVIWSGGGDQYKANHYRPMQDLLAKGLAVVTFDLLGVGESRQWPREPTADAHVAVLEHYMGRDDIDAEHIGFVGISRGGHYSLRVVTLNDPRIDAVVALCASESSAGASLVDEGLLGQGKTITTPLLVANGTRDAGNPVSEMMMTYESAVESDLWLLGLGEHCAVEYWPVVIPDVAEWLIEKFAQ